MSTHAERLALPPRLFWFLPAAVAVLRIAPYLWSLVLEPSEGMAVLNLGYNPRDFLSYLAFIRQFADGPFLALDPFTTEPHEPRFILLFHWIIGMLSRISGTSPASVLEISRIPLTFVFFWVLWWFLGPIVSSAGDRLATCVLIGLSGGLEGLVRLFGADIPTVFNPAMILQSTWHLFGWSTFQALHNPLWIAALILLLIVLRPMLQPAGPAGMADGWRIGGGFFLLFWVHPYSAIVVLAVLCVRPVVDMIFERPVEWRKYGRMVAALALPATALVLIGRWQSQDSVYRMASGNVFGTLQLPVFWYPLTLGAVGIVALRGARDMILHHHPYRFALLSWIAAVVLLHTSPILNGYHFLFYLHLPLCVVAAPVAANVFSGIRNASRSVRARSGMLLAALFVGFGLVTVESIGDVGSRNVIPVSYAAIVQALAEQPAANALAPPPLGNVIPAYTSHRVWVGHWFLTPDFARKAAAYNRMLAEPGSGELRSLITSQRIRYLVSPRAQSDAIQEALGSQIEERRSFGTHDLLLVRTSASLQP